MGEDFSAEIAADAPAIAGRQMVTAFRNNGTMPLICPTCQVALSNAGSRQLLCMGLFSIFWERVCRKRSSLILLRPLPQLEMPERGGDRLCCVVLPGLCLEGDDALALPDD